MSHSLLPSLIHLVAKIVAHRAVVQCAAQPRVVLHRHVLVQPPPLPLPAPVRLPPRRRVRAPAGHRPFDC